MAAGIDPILEADAVIQRQCPALWDALSPLGRRVRQPASFLPLQSAEARGKPFNATIGQITDGHGRAVLLPTMAAALAGLDDAERSRAFLYSPLEGLPELRHAWRDGQRWGQRPELPSSLPLVTCGTAHARSLALELFVGEGRAVALHQTGRPADRDLIVHKLGGRAIELPSSDFDPTALVLSDAEPAVLLLETRRENPASVAILGDALQQIAERRPVVVIVDDTWESLDRPSPSPFWEMIGRHPSLIPLKVDGADGHWGFPGGRIGFLTLPFEPDSEMAVAVESKLKMLVRAEVGSPSAMAQVILLRALAGVRLAVQLAGAPGR